MSLKKPSKASVPLTLLDLAKRWARTIKRDVVALYLAGRDRRTPWAAKVLAIAVVAYALSPIDLIPDFIPVLGYLDDLLIVPLGILFAVRLIPPDLMDEFRASALTRGPLPANRAAAVFVACVWVLLSIVIVWWLVRSLVA